MNTLKLVDVILLIAILLCAGDALRRLEAIRHPFRSTVFALMAIASFGWLSDLARGLNVQWWGLALHVPFAVYAVAYFVVRHPLGMPPSVPPSLRR